MRPDPRLLHILLLTMSFMLPLACKTQESLRPDCAVNEGSCVRNVNGLAVTLDISPKPVRAMQDLSFEVRLERDGRPAGANSVEVDLAMPGMQMGENRVRLQKVRHGLFQGRGVVVRCPSGQMLWKASVIVIGDGPVVTADFLLEVP